MATVTASDAEEGANLPNFDDAAQPYAAAPPYTRQSKQSHKPRDPAAPHLPKPPRYSMTPVQLFTYWEEMDKAHPDRLTAYVYRTWPVIDKRILDPKAYLYIAKESVAYPEPKDWRSEMLHRYGSGNYKIILTDDAMSKGIGQTLVTDLRDPEYPPVIENLDELVLDDPTNQSFLENLRQKGILPGQEKDDDMAVGEMTTALTGTIDKLTSRLAEQQKPQAAALPTQSATDAAKETVAMAREVFNQGIELGKATTQAQADAQVAAATAGQQTPQQAMGIFKEVADVLRSMQPAAAAPSPAPSGTAGVDAIQQITSTFMSRITTLEANIMEMQNARIAGLEKLITNPPAQAAATPAQKDDFFSNIDRLVAAKDKLQVLFGGGGDADAEPVERVPLWLQVAQTALAGLPSVATSLLAMSYNMAVAKTGQGSPVIPAAPSANPAPDPSSPSAMLGLGASTADDNPNPGNNPNPQPSPNGGGAYAMLKQIERPLLAHLNDPSKGGADFAAALMDFHGRIAYDAIRELGKDTIVTLLMSYPPIANVIKQIPQRADEFLDDFLEADAILEEGGSEGQDDQDDVDDTMTTAAPGTPGIPGIPGIPGTPGNPIDPELLPPIVSAQESVRTASPIKRKVAK